MLSCLDVKAWMLATAEERKIFYERKLRKVRKRRKAGCSLYVRTYLRPVDIYAYLRARFGVPNGIANFLRQDSSDNLIHWDFNLRSGDQDVYIAGHSREILFDLSEALTDEQWRSLLVGLKADFGRVSREKGEITRSFEKYLVFENKYVALADYCADLHARLVDAPPHQPHYASAATRRSLKRHSAALTDVTQRASTVYRDSVTLSLLTPVMVEAFLNMLILTLRRDSLGFGTAEYKAFLRATIPERLRLLPQNCMGFDRELDTETEAYRDFMRVMNKRNFAIHGNVDPPRERMETVYFEGKRPLFAEPGHHLMQHFEVLERLHRPDVVRQDYENVHAFLYEITTLLKPRERAFFGAVIATRYPGFETTLKRVNRILPDNVVMTFLQGTRYDDELKVRW
jgi:hypothetical protein